MAAINALSTYNLGNSRINHAHHRDLRHVACAVYVRMARYYDTHRKTGIVASLFGEETAMPYTMFASAVFFAPERHEDCEYRLDPIHIYRCQNGFWECMRIHGSRQKSSKLGEMMRACDQRLRLALDPAHPLKEEKVPKYLAKIIDDEIVAWLSWDAAHQPVKIDIDLSQLGHIRNAAAQTREALLIDEEREDDALTEAAEADSGQPEAEPAANMIAEPAAASTQQNEADEPTISTEQFGVRGPRSSRPSPHPQRPCPPAPHPHSPTPQKTIFVRCSSRTRRRQHRLWRGRARAKTCLSTTSTKRSLTSWATPLLNSARRDRR